MDSRKWWKESNFKFLVKNDNKILFTKEFKFFLDENKNTLKI